jgi:hypothetical protein
MGIGGEPEESGDATPLMQAAAKTATNAETDRLMAYLAGAGQSNGLGAKMI